MTGLVVGVDVGGTTADAVVQDAAGTLVAQARVATRRGPEGVAGSILQAAGDALARAGASRDQVAAVGIGVPGSVDPTTGTVAHAVNLAIAEEPVALAAAVAEVLGCPVAVENDVRCAAVAAHAHLARTIPGLADVAYLGIGTGVSAGLVLDGRLHRGRDGMAGEIGHVVVAPGAGRCACGLDGCLEVVASGRAIARRWPTDDPMPTLALFAAASDHDPAAAAVAADVVAHLTVAVHWLVAVTGVDAVVLGGGAGADDGPLAHALRESLAGHAGRTALSRQMFDPDRLHSLPSDLALGARGAARLAAARADAHTAAPTEPTRRETHATSEPSTDDRAGRGARDRLREQRG